MSSRNRGLLGIVKSGFVAIEIERMRLQRQHDDALVSRGALFWNCQEKVGIRDNNSRRNQLSPREASVLIAPLSTVFRNRRALYGPLIRGKHLFNRAVFDDSAVVDPDASPGDSLGESEVVRN